MLIKREVTLAEIFAKEGENSDVERSICMEESVSGLPEGNYNCLCLNMLINDFISVGLTNKYLKVINKIHNIKIIVLI